MTFTSGQISLLCFSAIRAEPRRAATRPALTPPPRHAGIPLSPCPPFPLIRSTDRKSLVRASTVLVLSIVHPSFQPILNLNQKTGAMTSVQSPLQAKCRASSTQRSRSRVTFVIFPATFEQHAHRKGHRHFFLVLLDLNGEGISLSPS